MSPAENPSADSTIAMDNTTSTVDEIGLDVEEYPRNRSSFDVAVDLGALIRPWVKTPSDGGCLSCAGHYVLEIVGSRAIRTVRHTRGCTRFGR